MSKDKALTEVATTDFTPEDQQKLQEFFDNGAPGFSLADEVKITKMMELYLSGKTYSQISRITRSPKELVMAYSSKLEWYPLKMQYLAELDNQMKLRLAEAKLQNKDFLIQMNQMWRRKIGKKMERYNQTDNDDEADAISAKELEKYLKTLDALTKLSTDPAPKTGQQAPAVGLNLGDGVTVTKTGENSVEITPKSQAVGNMLEVLANKRREAEAAKAEPEKKSDIKEVTPNKGENGNEKT